MENKKSFILYADLLKVVEKLPDEVAGKLFKIVLKYVNDVEVPIDDILLEIAFEPIKNQLKRDLKKWEALKKKRSEAGKKGGRPPKQEKAKKANALFEKQSKAKKAVNVTVTDTVNVTDTVTVNVPSTEGEKNGRALSFLKNKSPSKFEAFLMQNKKEIKNWADFENSFNDKMDLEIAQGKIEFDEAQLLPRLRSYARIWIEKRNEKSNQHGKSNNNNGNNFAQGYKPAKVDTAKLIQELTDDLANGNIPGEY